MPTFREVTIRIESRIEELDAAGLSMGEPEITSSRAVGYLRFGEGDTVLTYTESCEGGRVSTEITVSADTVTVARSGAIESVLRFREGEEHSSLYAIPPYKFDVKVLCRRMRCDLTDTGGTIDVLYNMSIGGADKAVRMKIWMQAS